MRNSSVLGNSPPQPAQVLGLLLFPGPVAVRSCPILSRGYQVLEKVLEGGQLLWFEHLDIDLPLCQTSGQPDVLSGLSYGKGEVIRPDEHLDGSLLFKNWFDLQDPGRRKGVPDKDQRIAVPYDHVYSFAAELFAYGLDPGTCVTDTGPYGIHVGIKGGYGYLGPCARLPYYLPDLDGPLPDLGDLKLKKLLKSPGWLRETTILGPLVVCLTSTRKNFILLPRE